MSNSPHENKNQLIRKLQQLPDEILENLYSLDIITLKGKMQFNDFLADTYRSCRALSHSESWLEFKISDWTIQMESED